MIDAAILVGGIGSRLGKITKNTPKPLIKIDKKRFLDYLLTKLSKYNFRKIYLLCSYKKHLFFNLYNNKIIHNSKIQCIDEGTFKGTGGALFKIKNKVTNNFVLLNGDTFFDIDYKKLTNINIDKFYGCIALTKRKNYKYNKKFINLKILSNNLLSFSKKKTNLMNGGVYFFNRKIFKLIKNKNLSLEDDVLNKVINNNKLKAKFLNSKFIDIGTKSKLSFIKRNSNFLKNRAIFLDRDGVVNKELAYILKYNKFIFLNGVKKAIKYINKNNYLVIIITNQAAVGKSLLKERELFNIHNKMKKKLWSFNKSYIDDIYYSPYFKYAKNKKYRLNKNDRKPGNGMLLKAINKWNIDIKNSKFIGDKNSDELASKKTNIKFYYKKKGSFFNQLKKILY